MGLSGLSSKLALRPKSSSSRESVESTMACASSSDSSRLEGRAPDSSDPKESSFCSRIRLPTAEAERGANCMPIGDEFLGLAAGLPRGRLAVLPKAPFRNRMSASMLMSSSSRHP